MKPDPLHLLAWRACLPPLLDPRKTSTPTQTGRNLGESSSLSQHESLLQIAVTTSTEFPELPVTATTSGGVPGTSLLQIEEDSSSTTSGPPVTKREGSSNRGD